jgi:hypothetical protein
MYGNTSKTDQILRFHARRSGLVDRNEGAHKGFLRLSGELGSVIKRIAGPI